jgi:hypothetical protein
VSGAEHLEVHGSNPEMGASAREAVDRHLQAVADHLAAVMWECAFSIVRSAQDEAAAPAPPPMADSLEKLVRTLHGEADRLTRQLTALRRRAAHAEEPRPPLRPVAEPAPPRRPRRASMRESGLGALFQRTEDPEDDSEPHSAGTPPVALAPVPSNGGNPRLIELARSVERRAVGPWLQGA